MSTHRAISYRALRPLARGDRVAVVAPSGPFERSAFERGLACLASRYAPVFTERIFAQTRYLAGPDDERLAELQSALDDDSIRAVFAARGGYGAQRLLPRLRLGAKPLVGFSDVTALHAAAQRAGLRSVHAPVLTQLGAQPPGIAERLFELLEGRPVTPLGAAATLVPGTAEGPLVGGNLAVLAALAGTPYLPPSAGAVLLLEDVGERPYRIDRLLTQLRQARFLDGIAGIVLGDFTDCEEPKAACGYTSRDVLASLAAEVGVPCAAGFPIGHGAVNHPVVLGARVRLTAPAGGQPATLELLEGLG